MLMKCFPSTRHMLVLLLLFMSSLPGTAEKAEALYDQGELPAFWKTRVEDIEAAVRQVRKGTVQVIAHSPGGRPVYLVSYGNPTDLKRQANYNSSIATRDIKYYANKDEETPPIVFFIGPARSGSGRNGWHGESAQVAETGGVYGAGMVTPAGKSGKNAGC